MSEIERSNCGDESYENDKRMRLDSREQNRNKRVRNTKKFKKIERHYDKDYSKSHKKSEDDHKWSTSNYYKNRDEHHSLSSDSETDRSDTHDREDGKKCMNLFSEDIRPLQAPKVLTSDNKTKSDQQGREDSDEEDFTDARALTLKTKMILSKLGWTAENIPSGINNLPGNGGDEKTFLKNDKLYDDYDSESDHIEGGDALPVKVSNHRETEESIEERRVLKGSQLSVKTRPTGDCEEQRNVRRMDSKTSYKNFSELGDGQDARLLRSSKNFKGQDDTVIALNIKECRNTIESGKDIIKSKWQNSCDEIRNVKVQPLSEKAKSKKRHCIDLEFEEKHSDFEANPVVSKRSKSSLRFHHEEDKETKDGKDDAFKECERRWIRVKDKSRNKTKRHRSRSTSSFSEESYSSYERSKWSKHSHKKHRRDARESYGRRENKYSSQGKRKDIRHYDEEDYDNGRSSRELQKTKFRPDEDLQIIEDHAKDDTKKEKRTKVQCDYFDEGSHWCERCNVVYEEAVDYLRHLHSDSHQKSVRKDPKPWAEQPEETSWKKSSSRSKISVPLKGLEFVFGTSAFYCKLCSELVADIKLAEKHMKSEKHNGNYRDFLQKNPRYQKRRTLDIEPRMHQAVRIYHQDEIPEPEMVSTPKIFEVEEETDEMVIKVVEEESVPSPQINSTNSVTPLVQVDADSDDRPDLEEKDQERQQFRESFSTEQQSCSSLDMSRHDEVEAVRSEPIVMELKSKPDKVTLDMKSAMHLNSTKNILSNINANTSSSLRKLPFIGKRPSKLSFKGDSEYSKPITTKSASLSREELLSRVMKDTVIVQPKDIRITPFPGIPPEAMMGSFMGGYMPMVNPYMGYPPYGGYYDISAYYDPSMYAAANAEVQVENSITQVAGSAQNASVEEDATEADMELESTNQDHYENYTIGCDSAPFESTINIEQVGDNQIPGSLESTVMMDNSDLEQSMDGSGMEQMMDNITNTQHVAIEMPPKDLDALEDDTSNALIQEDGV